MDALLYLYWGPKERPLIGRTNPCTHALIRVVPFSVLKAQVCTSWVHRGMVANTTPLASMLTIEETLS